ncbi:MAG TPA: tetratricopeptide repeat protein [Pirellulales bacterium]|jgi:lipoprotein NlpI|nr:tetratricopeptide repeat protein [Pirellulales bacterium]
MRRTGWGILVIAAAISNRFVVQGAEPPDLFRAAASAAREGKLTEATRLATQAIQAAPNETDGYRLRAGLYAAAGEHERAIADYDQLLKLDPQLADAYDQRGSQRFMLGQINQSIEDFDRFLELKPREEPRHWKRGISYYYAGRYDDGRRQFEGYQTVDDNDVENAVWRYLCMARTLGVLAARDAMLKIRKDPRVPMMEVYALYSGKATAENVLAAARADSPTPEDLNARLFYAHLYLGLFYEAAGDGRLAREHIRAAVDHKIGHYMWNVAQVHAGLLKTAGQP